MQQVKSRAGVVYVFRKTSVCTVSQATFIMVKEAPFGIVIDEEFYKHLSYT